MQIVEEYLDEVCSYIKYTPYRRAVRRELNNHIEDSIDAALSNGTEHEEAVKQAVIELGDAQEIGCKLNKQFTIRPSYRLVLYILGVYFLYIAASADINFSLAETLLTLSAFGGCLLLFHVLKRTDPEGNYHLIKYFYFGIVLLLGVVCAFADMDIKRNFASLAGVPLIFCVIFFVYRLHKSETLGFITAMFLFLLPIPCFLFSSAYAVLLLYLLAGAYTFICFLKRGWMCNEWVKVSFPIVFVGIIGLAVLMGSFTIIMKLDVGNYFFRNVYEHSAYLVANFRTYPLAACMSSYGYGALAVYILLISLVLFELIRMKRKVHNFLGRSTLNCIVLILVFKSAMAILLNLGFPFVRAYMLPFAGMGPDQITNLLMIVIAEYVYCFGDAIFTDCSFYEENKLLEMEEGKITLYYKN